ncbi:MAG TPA: hypothetical protein PK788_10780 [Gemmatimonadaceae bacterium]|nr:hypothetical protein [Gemmatimonadaceae bacterium]HRQ78315.1 hypothetical protein [Gemmatimonadaceae bacterium]
MTRTRTGRRGVSAAAAAAAALLLAFPLRPLEAQLIQVPMDDRRSLPVSVQASVGYLLVQNRFDGISGQNWYFGDAWQYRVSADVGLSMGSLGVAGTLATVPLQRGNSTSSNGEIQLRQLLATFRSPEPRSFGQIFELGLGLSQWAEYAGTDVVSGDDAKPRNAVAVAIGYGVSIPLGARFAAQLMQDYTTAIGSREGLPVGARRAQEQYTTRIGLRWRAAGAQR